MTTWQDAIKDIVELIPYTIGYTVESDPESVHTIMVTSTDIIEALKDADFRIRGYLVGYEIIFIKKKYL